MKRRWIKSLQKSTKRRRRLVAGNRVHRRGPGAGGWSVINDERGDKNPVPRLTSESAPRRRGTPNDD